MNDKRTKTTIKTTITRRFSSDEVAQALARQMEVIGYKSADFKKDEGDGYNPPTFTLVITKEEHE